MHITLVLRVKSLKVYVLNFNSSISHLMEYKGKHLLDLKSRPIISAGHSY